MYDLPFRGTNSRPGSISAECFQHSFLSMEYSDSCQAQVREQTGQARRTGWRSVRPGNVWRFAWVIRIYSSIGFCCSDKLGSVETSQKSLRKETTIVISWIYLGGGSWILMNFSDMTIRDVLSGPTVARWHCWLWPAAVFVIAFGAWAPQKKTTSIYEFIHICVCVDLYMFIDNMNTCLQHVNGHGFQYLQFLYKQIWTAPHFACLGSQVASERCRIEWRGVVCNLASGAMGK